MTHYVPIIPGLPLPADRVLGGLYRAIECNPSVGDATKANGIYLLYIGALLGAVAVACHVLIAMEPTAANLWHRVAEYAFAAGVGATVAGAWLAALGTMWNWIMGAVVIAALGFLMYYARRKGITIPKPKGRPDGK